MSAEQTTTDPAATGTTGDGAPAQPAEKSIPQTEVSRLMARTEGKYKEQMAAMAREREELSQRLAALEAERQQEAESRMNATQRAELQQKRDREAWEKKVSDLSAQATRERAARHQLLVKHAAASKVASIAPKLFNASLTPHLESIVSSALVVVDDGQGGESVHIRTGSAPGETEPLTPEAWAEYESSQLSGFYRAEGGAGARHGGGAGNGSGKLTPEQLRKLPPVERIASGFKR